MFKDEDSLFSEESDKSIQKTKYYFKFPVKNQRKPPL